MTRLAPTLMIQGTASSVGKSLLVAALCRIYARRGISVAPFKAQNMALNAHVTADGREVGRAQALQARACGLVPEVAMNPILLKPEADARAQVIVMGRSQGTTAAGRYHEDKLALRKVVVDALTDLRRRYDLVLIEGAGSPAEINLRARDLVNMFVAHAADAPVLLVGDIDRGGVLAHLVGTLALLDHHDQRRIRGLLINKFRGDVELLRPGLLELESRTDRPVLGVIPHVPRLRLGDEDSLSLEDRGAPRRPLAHELDIVVIRLPRLSNSDDFDALAAEPDVVVHMVDDPATLLAADLAIIPGSKSTVADLQWLRDRGLQRALQLRAARGQPILGICGGMQMLGIRIADPGGFEAAAGTMVEGMGLLAISTTFTAEKTTRLVQVRSQDPSSLLGAFEAVTGYWIHAGRIDHRGSAPFEVRVDDDPWQPEGATQGSVLGTMVHGLFEHHGPRARLLADLAARRGLERSHDLPPVPNLDAEIDRFADTVAAHVDMAAIDGLLDPAPQWRG